MGIQLSPVEVSPPSQRAALARGRTCRSSRSTSESSSRPCEANVLRSCWDGVKGRPMGVWSTPRVAASADARSLSEPPTLDREGFALEKHRTSVADFYDPAAVEQVYYAEIAELLRRATGAEEVHVFDHTLRVEDEAKRRVHGTRLLVTVVHNDYTERSALQRVRDVLAPETAERLLAGRFAIVNVWRSFGASPERFPLAVADGRTVLQTDYVTVDLVYPDRTGEVCYTAHSSGQRWFYFSRMQPNEAMLFKCFDSARDGRTRYTIAVP